MKKEKDVPKSMSHFTVKDIVIAGICSYIAAIFTLPSMGVFTKLPIAFLFSFVASLFCTSKSWVLSMMAIMPFILNLLYGFELQTALVSAIACVVAGWFGILARRAFFTLLASKRQKNDKVYAKSLVVLVLSIIAGVLVQIIM